jgi:hypothetical protein
MTNRTRGVVVLALCVGAPLGCKATMSAKAESSSSAEGAAAGDASGSGSGSGSGAASENIGTQAGAMHEGNSGVHFEWHAHAKISSNFKTTKPMSDKVGASGRGRVFVGIHGRAEGHAEGHGHGHGKAEGHHKHSRGAEHASATGRAHASDRSAIKGKTPSDDELKHPIDPPKDPPSNVFGYDKPVKGCFEGAVYFLDPETKRLPGDYNDMDPSSVLYACEWDIPTRDWKQGFPGIPQQFEWFAIRYSGDFAIQTKGKYSFRLASDDGSKLTIDGKVVINNDGQHPPTTKTGSIELSPGDHEMVLEYFQGPRYLINLQLYVTPPGGEEGLFSVR